MNRNKQLRLCFLLTLLVFWAGVVSLPANPQMKLAATPSAAKGSKLYSLENPDRQCQRCHEAIYNSYERTPMARGSGVPSGEDNIPASGERGFVHEPSGIAYRIRLQNGQATLSFERPPGESQHGLRGERPLIYFIGSGLRGRTYLYQLDDFWFESPINWYAKKHIWDMAPAYEQTHSMPDALPVDANCLHCHASGVQTATGGARNHFPGAPFRVGGVSCVSCHGDPTAHLASAGASRFKSGNIVNPDHLDAVRRDDICLQCHLEGDATVYLPGKSLAQFKPGEALSKSALYFVDSNRAQQGGRATSQYEALLRSACKRATGDRLTCTTCHDPHSSPAPAERVAYFRSKCLVCLSHRCSNRSNSPPRATELRGLPHAYTQDARYFA